MTTPLRHKILLDEDEMPTRWYNVLHDLPTPPPPVLHPGTGQPVGPDDLAPLFPMDLILQEVSGEQYVDIPPEVLDVYRLWRPSPLYRAHRLEKALGTPARIYYKYEGVSPAGSHKPNTAVPQAYYNAKAEGITETHHRDRRRSVGHGARLRVGRSSDWTCEVWQVARLVRPEAVSPAHDGDVRRHRAPESPSDGDLRRTRTILAAAAGLTPARSGWRSARPSRLRRRIPTVNGTPSARVLNHVLMHQTIIGEEALLQLAKLAGDTPGRDHRLYRRRLELRWAHAFPFLREKLGRSHQPRDRARRRACVVPVVDPRGRMRTTSVTPPA